MNGSMKKIEILRIDLDVDEDLVVNIDLLQPQPTSRRVVVSDQN